MEECTTINIAAFVADELMAAERERVERHLDRCSDCRTIAVSLAVPDSRVRSAPLSPGDRVDQYVVERFLGAGGMGTVYSAEDRDLGRRVALKVLDADQAPLEGEARALARLSHPNVITVYGVGRWGDATYVATEVVDGLPLQRWVVTVGPSFRGLIELFAVVGRALLATHAAGLVHRDVKPENIVVSADGTPRLIDFGLAHLVDSSPVDTVGEALPQSRAVGTPGAGTGRYMAPEQRRHRADQRSDQYSFCVTVTEMMRLAGHRAPRRLQAALARGCAQQPDDRFADLRPLVDRLERVQRAGPRRRQLAWTALAVGVAAAAAGVAGKLSRAADVDASPVPVLRNDLVATPSWPPGTTERLERSIRSGDVEDAEERARVLLAQSEAQRDDAGRVEAFRLLAMALDHQNRGDEADEAISQGLRLAERADLPRPTAALWIHRASRAVDKGEFEAVLRDTDFAHFVLARNALLDSALGVQLLGTRGEALRRLGRLTEAREILNRAREQALRFDPTESNLAQVTLSLGYVFIASPLPAEQEQGRVLLEEGLAEALGEYGPDTHTEVVFASTLAREARQRGAHEEALDWLSRAIDAANNVYGPDNPYYYRLSTNRLTMWRALPGGEFGARLELEHYDRRLSTLLGPEHPSIAVVHQHLGRIAMAEDRLEDAVLAYQRVLGIRERLYGTEHVLLTVPLEALERCQRLLGHAGLADAHAARLAKIKASKRETASPRPG